METGNAQMVSALSLSAFFSTSCTAKLCCLSHLCVQGFPGDFGERGPPGPDGNPVSTSGTSTIWSTAMWGNSSFVMLREF